MDSEIMVSGAKLWQNSVSCNAQQPFENSQIWIHMDDFHNLISFCLVQRRISGKILKKISREVC